MIKLTLLLLHLQSGSLIIIQVTISILIHILLKTLQTLFEYLQHHPPIYYSNSLTRGNSKTHLTALIGTRRS